jgi:hypothetical protein
MKVWYVQAENTQGINLQASKHEADDGDDQTSTTHSLKRSMDSSGYGLGGWGWNPSRQEIPVFTAASRPAMWHRAFCTTVTAILSTGVKRPGREDKNVRAIYPLSHAYSRRDV